MHPCGFHGTPPAAQGDAGLHPGRGRSRIDQALVTWFPAPASYTGEDTAEISCHGGMLVTDRLLKRLYQCGASPAEPGEFTKRAFLNGRMDLTQAEAVRDVFPPGATWP